MTTIINLHILESNMHRKEVLMLNMNRSPIDTEP